jgi:hypothetical protein
MFLASAHVLYSAVSFCASPTSPVDSASLIRFGNSAGSICPISAIS